MKKLLLLPFLLLSIAVFSQKTTVEGIIKDADKAPMEGATVYMQSAKDSTTVAYAITDKNGGFSMKVQVEDHPAVIFRVAYVGYKTYTKNLQIKEETLNMGDILMEEGLEELAGMTVEGEAPPILIKEDTIEYNADSFKSLPNEKVEDLLKKLPGVAIDSDGVITVNGARVDAVTVDGMSFFGEKNGSIALKNLPSIVVDKVQVTDYKTDLQKFTGEDSDSGTKEINLKIKKEKNNAFFGNTGGGYGTADRYQANTNLFKMIEGKQIGVIGGANNIGSTNGFGRLPGTHSMNGDVNSKFFGGGVSPKAVGIKRQLGPIIGIMIIKAATNKKRSRKTFCRI